MIWVFAPKICERILQMVPLTRKGVIERDGMCSTIRAGGDGSSAQMVDRSTEARTNRAHVVNATPPRARGAPQRSPGSSS
jgi:hypothetical protein